MLLYAFDAATQQKTKIAVSEFSAAILEDLNNQEVPTEDEIQTDLGNYYLETITQDAGAMGVSTALSVNIESIDILGFGRKLWDQVKDYICPVITDQDTQDTVLDWLLKALSAIIPGAILVDWLVKKLLKFILHKGIGNLCA